MIRCQNFCPNDAEYTFHVRGKEPVHVCQAHVYVYKATNTDYVVQPITLAGHIAAYKESINNRRQQATG